MKELNDLEILDNEEEEVVDDDKFHVWLDDKYFLRRDKFQFKLGYFVKTRDKEGNEIQAVNNCSYHPTLYSALIEFIEICGKVKAKEIKELVKEYRASMESLKVHTKPVSDLTKQLYREIDELRLENTELKSKANKIQIKLEKKVKG